MPYLSLKVFLFTMIDYTSYFVTLTYMEKCLPISCKEEVRTWSLLCQENTFSLNIDKTKEIIMDWREREKNQVRIHSPFTINGATKKWVNRCKTPQCFKHGQCTVYPWWRKHNGASTTSAALRNSVPELFSYHPWEHN